MVLAGHSSGISSLPSPPPGCTFLNMVATHDGIGLMPAAGLLSETEIADTVASVLESTDGAPARDLADLVEADKAARLAAARGLLPA